MPNGFMLSEAAQYAYSCQDVFPDTLSFALAIPDHLKQLFLVPVKIELASDLTPIIAARIASSRLADGTSPDGLTEESDLFGTKTFTYNDLEPTVPSSEPGSIFNQDEADAITHHQEYNYDQNILVPSDTSYLSDIDITQYMDYPYRTKEKPVRHSSIIPVIIVKIAVKPESLETHAPPKIKDNAESCSVKFTSYDKKRKIYTFEVKCKKGPRTVQAALSDIDNVTMFCDCPFWRWNGPEFHAKQNKFLLGPPIGTAGPPNVRDPDRKFWLCKHTYAVLKRLEEFVSEVVQENWDMNDEELLAQVDKEWDRLEGVSRIPADKLKEEIDVEVKE